MILVLGLLLITLISGLLACVFMPHPLSILLMSSIYGSSWVLQFVSALSTFVTHAMISVLYKVERIMSLHTIQNV